MNQQTKYNKNKNTKTWQTWELLLFAFFIIAITLLFSLLFSTCNRSKVYKESVIHKTDTIVQRNVDSIFVDHYYKLPGKIDTVFVFNNVDSLILRGYAKDTIYIEKLQLKFITRDTIIHDTVLIEKFVDKKVRHCGIGVTAGLSAVYGLHNRKFDYGPSVGVGITYKF